MNIDSYFFEVSNFVFLQEINGNYVVADFFNDDFYIFESRGSDVGNIFEECDNEIESDKIINLVNFLVKKNIIKKFEEDKIIKKKYKSPVRDFGVKRGFLPKNMCLDHKVFIAICIIFLVDLAIRIQPMWFARFIGMSSSKNNICSMSKLYKIIKIFNKAIIYYPFELKCFANSFAMLVFLRFYGIEAFVTIGVRLDPFQSHAWVQKDGVVLNDEFAAVRTFSPVAQMGAG